MNFGFETSLHGFNDHESNKVFATGELIIPAATGDFSVDLNTLSAFYSAAVFNFSNHENIV